MKELLKTWLNKWLLLDNQPADPPHKQKKPAKVKKKAIQVGDEVYTLDEAASKVSKPANKPVDKKPKKK
jgi:hypothetical protein